MKSNQTNTRAAVVVAIVAAASWWCCLCTAASARLSTTAFAVSPSLLSSSAGLPHLSSTPAMQWQSHRSSRNTRLCSLRLEDAIESMTPSWTVTAEKERKKTTTTTTTTKLQDEIIVTREKQRNGASIDGPSSFFASSSSSSPSSWTTPKALYAVPENYRPTPVTSPLKSTSSTSESTAALDADNSTDLPPMSVLESFAWKGVVAILCALWASNFPVAKLIMSEPNVDSSLYAVSRFAAAAAALTPGALWSVRKGHLDWETAKGAAICGAWVAFGYMGQTLGLLTTTASKSCVICSMHCVFVAIVAEWMRVGRKREAVESGAMSLSSTATTLSRQGATKNSAAVPISDAITFDTMRLLPAVVAVAGVAIVELRGAAGPPTIGDLLSFAQPIGFGMGYLQLEELMKKRPEAALPVSAIKLLVVMAASFTYFELDPLLKGTVDAADWSLRLPDVTPILASPIAFSGILYTSLITTALALWVESIAFKRVPATDASIILTTEPLFAAGLGAVTLGETFGLSDYVGASLIIGACILAVLLEDSHVDVKCDPDSPEDCVAPRSTPFVE